ncbi:MAG: hypothetical protein HY319_01780 [Armatimonadetes bacterium]|nr:hypothetical protein [Armatimonadota bacterium]
MENLVLLAVDPSGRRYEWRLSDAEYLVGRADGHEAPGRLVVEGDPHLSRQQFRVHRHDGRWWVTRCHSARNPLFFQGQETDRFELQAGDGFFTGKTRFSALPHADRLATLEHTLGAQSRDRARLRRLEDCFGAVLELLRALRREAGDGAPWRTAFPVVRRVLPEVQKLAFVRVQLGPPPLRFEMLEEDEPGSCRLGAAALEKAFQQGSTVTYLWDEPPQPGEGTLSAQASWTIVSPIRVLDTGYAFCAFGASYPSFDALEETAAVIDLAAELVGHHLVVEQAAEYGSLLGVFGHHVGTLFKTSGALHLWSGGEASEPVQRVLDNLLPIWGISQAISLYKKQGEQEWRELLSGWVAPGWAERADLAARVADSLRHMVRYIYGAGQAEAPFLPWTLDGEPLSGRDERLSTLPPLCDNPVLFDKTLAFTIGLLEMLNNLRKYPEARGAGREDRRELAGLEPGEKNVEVRCRAEDGEAFVEVVQPVVTDPDGGIPASRSLERIRTLEFRLLRGLVETGSAEPIARTSLPHIVRVRQRWTYRWGRLLEEWRACCGEKASPSAH